MKRAFLFLLCLLPHLAQAQTPRTTPQWPAVVGAPLGTNLIDVWQPEHAAGSTAQRHTTIANFFSAMTSAQVAAALGYTPVNRAGDTLTGYLTLHAAPANNFHAATKKYVDDSISASGTPPGGSSGQLQVNNAGAFGGMTAMNGDATLNTSTGALTLATSGVSAGSYGSATLTPTFTVDAKGRLTVAGTTTTAPPLTAISGVTITSPATGQCLKYQNGSVWVNVGCSRTYGVAFGDGSTVTATGALPGIYIEDACTITKAVLMLFSFDSGSTSTTSVEVWASSSGIPTASDKISAFDPVNTNAAAESVETTLSGWTTSIAAGTRLIFNITANDHAKSGTAQIICK